MILVAFVVALIISSALVNGAQTWLMKFLGADAMLFNAKSKLVIIVIVALLLLAPFHNLF